MMDCPFNNLCEKYKEYAPVVLRVVVGLLFAVHGYQKLTLMGVDAFAGMLAGMGIPLAGVMAWVVILTEVIGGIALVLGIGSRHFSTLLAIIMTVAILKVKLVKGWGEYNYDLMLLIACISLILSGPGPLALEDAVCPTKKKKKK